MLGLILVVTGRSSASAQTAGPAPALSESLQAIARLMTRVPNASVSLNFAEFKVRLAAGKLQELAATWPAESPVDYRANVARQAAVLEQSLGTLDVEGLTKLLDAIAEDLTAKVDHAQKGGSAAVMVQVRAVSGGQEASDWQVLYRPRPLEAAGIETGERFPQLAGTTRAALAPGRYVLWGRENRSGAIGTTVTITVGEGVSNMTLDLEVPAPASR